MNKINSEFTGTVTVVKPKEEVKKLISELIDLIEKIIQNYSFNEYSNDNFDIMKTIIFHINYLKQNILFLYYLDDGIIIDIPSDFIKCLAKAIEYLNDINNLLKTKQTNEVEFKKYLDIFDNNCRNIIGFSENIFFEQVAKKYNNILSIATKCDIFKQDIEDLDKKSIDLEKEIKGNISGFQKKLDNIDQQLIQTGLANSFFNRAEKLKDPIKYWLYASISMISFIPIILAVFEYYFPFSADNLIASSAVRTPTILALVWLAWFCSKRYSYIYHLQDDYNYKYDLAMAYKGYSGEVQKLKDHEQLITLLLASLIENISQSPLDRIKSEPHTPWAETISPIIEKMEKKAKAD